MGHRYSITWILVCGFNFAKFYNWQFAHIIFNWFKCFRLTKLPSSHYLKPVGTLYKVDVYLPIFLWKQEPYRWTEIVEILLGFYEPECLCTSQQLMISNNVTFLISNANFKNVIDIAGDEMGAWKHNSSPIRRFDVDESTRSSKIKPSKANDLNSYTLKSICYKNKSSPDLRKTVSIVIGTFEFSFIFESLRYDKTFIELDLAQGISNSLFGSAFPY